MKKTNIKLLSLLSALFIIASLFSFTSCDTASSSTDIAKAEINSSGELIITYNDGTEKNLGVVSIGGGTTVVIDGNEGDVSSATTIGLCSAVSVSAKFTKTVKNPYIGMYPGFGSGGSSTTEYSSSGSGVIYELDGTTGSGFVITNYHVVYDSSSDTGVSEDITLYLYGAEGADYGISAEYVGGSLYYDIAVLRIDNVAALIGSVYRAATIAASGGVSAGDSAIAIGNPESYGISASLGIVSVASEYITMTAADGVSQVTQRVMRVDTAVNSGNSGGGLYNDRGELIGIVNAKIVDDSVENIGYAIPAEVACAVADNIIDNCYGKENDTVMRATLGISLTVSDSHAVIDTATGEIGIEETVSVYSVTAGSTADGALQVGDILVSAAIGDTKVSITRRHHIIDLMLHARVGDTLNITLIRGGETKTVAIEITEAAITAYLKAEITAETKNKTTKNSV